MQQIDQKNLSTFHKILKKQPQNQELPTNQKPTWQKTQHQKIWEKQIYHTPNPSQSEKIPTLKEWPNNLIILFKKDRFFRKKLSLGGRKKAHQKKKIERKEVDGGEMKECLLPWWIAAKEKEGDVLVFVLVRRKRGGRVVEGERERNVQDS